jgi:GTPase SAR1 family protein
MSNITLTDKQQEIYDDFIERVHNWPGRSECVLVGYAGTGKTTLVAEIVDSLYKGYNIAVTSPTHKANSVIRKMLMQNVGLSPQDAQVSTIHSFLGLKLVYEKSRQVLKHDPQSKNSTSMVDVLIVDECSMISDEMYQHIIDQMYRVRRAVIFVGDSCQLPPVESEGTMGESKLSPTFDVETKYELTEVLRQALDNPIISIATSIRECIGTNGDPLAILDTTYGLDTIIPIDDEQVFLDVYKEMILEHKGSASKIFDFVQENKIIAYTNYRVSLSNIYIRSELFDKHQDVEFVKGEPIVFDTVTENCPYMNQEIIQCPEVRKEAFLGIDCWQFKLPNGNYILGVGPESKMGLDDYLDKLIKKIERKDMNPLTKRAYQWQDYYIIKNKINIINYPYATTAHKSQGSTFDNIWFDTDFIERIRNNDTKCRIIYTAMTRPRYNVMFRKNGMF